MIQTLIEWIYTCEFYKTSLKVLGKSLFQLNSKTGTALGDVWVGVGGWGGGGMAPPKFLIPFYICIRKFIYFKSSYIISPSQTL